MSPKPNGPAQDQFLDVIDRDEAERRFHAALRLSPTGIEELPIGAALGRILATNIVARIDVPSFDRSNLDGFAVRAEDTYGATETRPLRLRLTEETIATAVIPEHTVGPQEATPIATGGMLPRGADAIMMVEHTEIDNDHVIIHRSVTQGQGISFAGTDIGAGETVLHRGDPLASRETGVLAAIGQSSVPVYRRPRVAIISTGDEIIEPGQTMRPGLVYDSNAQILADAVHELGGEPIRMGIVHDDKVQLRKIITQALQDTDVVLLSGGTSKGEGDLSYRVVRELKDPGIVAHGVALKPGKPICLAVSDGKPVVILPGFPTSAVFTFHEFVAPVIRQLAGRDIGHNDTILARLAIKTNSEIGRTEYLLVGLVQRDDDPQTPFAAYPMGKGSGSVTSFSRADGFITIKRQQEILEQNSLVEVQLIGDRRSVADLVIIGSHCVGVDLLISHMREAGYRCKFLAVGSTAGLEAAKRGECDVAGIHLLDATTGTYNVPFLTEQLELVTGYPREQGLIYRTGDERFESCDAATALSNALASPNCKMVNRNAGSGTRILIDQMLDGKRPSGYAIQPRSHNAVAAAIAQGRGDWGVGIARVARQHQLGFIPTATEQFDFVIPKSRKNREAVKYWMRLLDSRDVRTQLNPNDPPQ